MKLIVGGHHLWRDAALIADILEKCQASTDETLCIVPAPGRCGTLARRVANRVGYTVIEPPRFAKGTSLADYNAALVEANRDADLMLVFHDSFFCRGKPKRTRTRSLTDEGVALDMDIILVTQQHGTVELN